MVYVERTLQEESPLKLCLMSGSDDDETDVDEHIQRIVDRCTSKNEGDGVCFLEEAGVLSFGIYCAFAFCPLCSK